MSPATGDFSALADHILGYLRDTDPDQSLVERVVSDLYEQIPYYNWVGIYYQQGETLTLGPFRGEPSPHTTIPIDQGICGAAAREKATVIVPDVNADERYLSCSIKTKSEIVVPIMDENSCLGEIDIDSHQPDAFSPVDWEFLERIAHALAPIVSTTRRTR